MLWVDNQSVTSSAAQSIQFFMIKKLRLSFDIVLKVNNKIPRLHLLWACEAVLTLDLKVLKNKQTTNRQIKAIPNF